MYCTFQEVGVDGGDGVDIVNQSPSVVPRVPLFWLRNDTMLCEYPPYRSGSWRGILVPTFRTISGYNPLLVA